MAEFRSNNDRGYRIRLLVEQTSQNIASNSSQVRVRLDLLNTLYTFDQYNCSAYVDFNGQRLNWSGRPTVLSQNSTTTLIDQTITVNHNADGTKSFGLSASFSGSGGWSPGTLSISGNSFALTTIPRSSSVSVGSAVIGNSLAITINRNSDSFKHTIKYAWGNKSGTIASGVDTSYNWTIPTDFANDVPNSTSGTGTITVETYSGGTYTGSRSAQFTATVPDNYKPTFGGVTLSDSNTAAQNLISNATTFIQIISNIRVNFNNASGSYGSTITGYRAEIVGRNQSTTVNGGTLGIMPYNGTVTIRASVSDSRGRWSDTRDTQVTILEYFAPAFSFDITRSGSGQSTFTATRNAKIAPLTVGGTQRNSMTLTFNVSPLNANTYVVDNGSASGTWLNVNNLIRSQANFSGTYASNKSWTVIGTLSDKFTSTEFVTFVTNVTTEKVVYGYDKDGRISFGKIPELGPAGSADVAGLLYSQGSEAQNHRLTQANGIIDRVSHDTHKTTGFGCGLISSFFSKITTKGIFRTYFSGNQEATQLWVSHDGGAQFGRYRDYSTGQYRPFKAVGIDNFYPIGAIFQSTNSTNPAELMGGTWERFGNGRVLVGVDETDPYFNTALKTGGAKTHTLTIAEMPSHSHGQKVSANNGPAAARRDWSSDGSADEYPQGLDTFPTGGGQPHNNLQPYVTIYMWRRIA